MRDKELSELNELKLSSSSKLEDQEQRLRKEIEQKLRQDFMKEMMSAQILARQILDDAKKEVFSDLKASGHYNSKPIDNVVSMLDKYGSV